MRTLFLAAALLVAVCVFAQPTTTVDRLRMFLTAYVANTGVKVLVTEYKMGIGVSAVYKEQSFFVYFANDRSLEEMMRVTHHGIMLLYLEKRVKLYTFNKKST